MFLSMLLDNRSTDVEQVDILGKGDECGSLSVCELLVSENGAKVGPPLSRRFIT